MDESQEFHDVFEGVKVVWSLRKIVPNTNSVSFYPAADKSFYLLKFHRSHRDFVEKSYLNHVLEQETNMTPADVAENLMPKVANEDVETSLERLIQALRTSKEDAEKKAKKEAEMKSEKEEGTIEEDSSKEDAEDKKLEEEENANGKS
ncbi:hypothetical protein TSUD_58760 [Trifolium subterraneum]|uniref:AAA+ ATPase At3g28540-like C-terminal domain-containing protein n=1 Tax=Trifolium subterraneum TaxID=3900 RepID=A0A2Z6MZE0_TRISU|nr:hypothetical protein TSUD_58760 [Trifolium subterraneum]